MAATHLRIREIVREELDLVWPRPKTRRYSVSASAVGRPVEIRAYAERIELRQDGRVIGESICCCRTGPGRSSTP